MNALRQIKAKLRHKHDQAESTKPVISQPRPAVPARLPPSTSELCDACAKLLEIVQEKPAESFSFPASAAELQDMPPLSCSFCYLRWRSIPPVERQKLRGCRKIKGRFFKEHQGGFIWIMYSYPNEPAPGSGSLRDYRVELGCQPCMNLALQPDLNSSSPSTFSIIANWIDTCHNKHEGCKSAFLRTLPTSAFPAGRILDLEPSGFDPSTSGYIRLVDGQSLKADSKYISLSHQWGSYKPLKLTKREKEDFKKGIHTQFLPRTFADAVDITKRLRVRYLWIDSMCIVQDDESDWKTESAKMAQIYECAWLNIAAVKAQDARGGCYAKRNRWDVTPVVAHMEFQRAVHHHYVLFNRDFWDVNIQRSSLLYRAWVQQEQFFSQRILYFAQNQVFWKCQQLTACETFPDGMPRFGEGNRLHRTAYRIASLKEGELMVASDLQQRLLEEWTVHKYTFRRYLESPPPEDHPLRELIEAWKISSRLLQIWSAIVGQYSSCQLTFPAKDKLVAISGLARRCGHGSEYLAGLWKPTLPWQLLWRLKNHQIIQSSSRLPGLPSWSWTCLHQGVFMHDHLAPYGEALEDDQSLIKVLKAETSLVGDDPFGHVDGGIITLSGFLFKSKISAVQTTVRKWSQSSTDYKWKHEVYCRDDFGKRSEGLWGFYLAVLKSPIYGRIDMKATASNIRALQGLWLEPTRHRHGEYRRRGIFDFLVEPYKLWPDEFQAQFDQLLEPEEYEEYEGVHSVGVTDSLRKYHRYTITLV